jgi:hypothetical protein
LFPPRLLIGGEPNRQCLTHVRSVTHGSRRVKARIAAPPGIAPDRPPPGGRTLRHIIRCPLYSKAAAMPLGAGARLGRDEVVELLGSGGMGEARPFTAEESLQGPRWPIRSNCHANERSARAGRPA